MQAAVIIELDPLSEIGAGLSSVLPGVQIDALALRRPPQVLDENLVPVATLAIRGDAGA